MGLTASVAELRAELEERRQACELLERDRGQVASSLAAERASAADSASREGALEQKLAAAAADLLSEQSRSRDLSVGLDQQSTE